MSEFIFDLQRFTVIDDIKTDFNALKLLHDLITRFGLKELAQELMLKEHENFNEWLKDNANPILKFIGAFWEAESNTKTKSKINEWVTIFTRFVSIIDNAYDIHEETLKDTPSKSKISSKIESILSDTVALTNSIIKLGSDKNSFLLSVVSAGIGLVASIVAGADGIDEGEKDKIYSSYVLLLKSVGSEIVKKFFSASIDAELDKIDLDDAMKNVNILKKAVHLDELSDKFTKGGGLLDLIFSVITGVLNATNEYDERLKKYTDDGIPLDIAKHDAFIDAVGKFVHDTASTYTKGLDDVIFKGVQTLVSWITKKEAYDPDKNYVEVICDLFKTLSLPKSTAGKLGDDDIVFFLDNSMFYSDDGNDYIGIAAANSTIWAGHGDDIIVSSKEQFKGYSLPVKNSIFGGSGNDAFSLYDNQSTVYGGAGKDSITICGKYNNLFGDNGDDRILLANGSDYNTVEGGQGNDIIGLENIENIAIYYKDGDGDDIIFGFNEKDELKISGEYYLFTSGEDIIVKVGEGSILLYKAAGKNLNINNNTDHEFDNGTAPEISSPVDGLPSFEDFSKGVKQFSIITGTDGDDEISNDKEIAIINALDGDDTVENSDNVVTVNGGNGNDSIKNNGSDVTINGGEDNDRIYNSSLASNVEINGETGNDTITNRGSDVTINSGTGNDYIGNYFHYDHYEYGSSVTIDCGDGNDTVSNSGSSVSIDSGDGDDSINNGGRKVTIKAGAGNDVIRNSGSKVTINAGAGDDSIYNMSGTNAVSINGGEDNDYVYNELEKVTINGGAGDDSVINRAYTVKIKGGDGKDSIVNYYSEVTIDGDDGDDYIENLGDYYSDVKKVTINGGVGNDAILNRGSNVKITGGDGDDSIKNISDRPYAGGNVTIDSDSGNDEIQNEGYNVKIDSGDGTDYVRNFAGDVTIDGSAGNDTIITAWDYSNISINAGDGDDYIENRSNNVTLDGGDGDDRIEIHSDVTYKTKYVKVSGGTGNDSINFGSYAKNNLVEYKLGDGLDTISGFNGDATLSISGGDYSTQESGNDIIVTVGDGSIRLKDTKGQALNIIGTYKPYTPPADTTPADTTPADTTPADTTPADTTPADTTPADTTLTITNADKSPVTLESSIEVADASSRTKAVKITGNALDNKIIGGTGNDTLDGAAGNDNLKGGKGDDVFVYSAGNDTITDYGTGNDKISLSTAVKNFGASDKNFVFKFNDGSLTLTDAASKKISLTSGKVTNVYTDEGIFNSMGTAVTLSPLTGTFTADSKVVTIDASLTSGATVTGNSKANKISLGDGNVFVWTNGGNDTLMNFGTDNLLSITGAVSDGSVKSGNTYLKIGSNKITVKDSSQVTFADNDGTRIFDGGIFYDENKISATLGSAVKEFDSTDTDVVDITGNDKANKFVASSTDTTLTGGKGNDTFVHTNGNDFITDYGNGSDKISLGAASIESFSVTDGNVKLDLDKGSITIANGAGKKISLVSGKKTTANVFTGDGIFDTSGKSVTLNASTETFTADSKVVTIDASSTSGATITGNSKANKVYLGDENIFVWSQGGNDTLMNFGADDLLSVVGAVSDGSISGGNSIIKIGSNKITVKDSSQVTFADNDGTKIFDGGFFYDTEKTSATLASATKDFDATNTDVVDITGNAKANKLYAGDEDTTLAGGKGNDSLWGGDGADTFIYDKGDGKDIIYGFDDNDLLEIHGLNGSVTGKFNAAGTELTVKVGSTDVSVLKDFGSTTTFNVTANGIAHQITK